VKDAAHREDDCKAGGGDENCCVGEQRYYEDARIAVGRKVFYLVSNRKNKDA
jgi:hypothetical protein